MRIWKLTGLPDTYVGGRESFLEIDHLSEGLVLFEPREILLQQKYQQVHHRYNIISSGGSYTYKGDTKWTPTDKELLVGAR